MESHLLSPVLVSGAPLILVQTGEADIIEGLLLLFIDECIYKVIIYVEIVVTKLLVISMFIVAQSHIYANAISHTVFVILIGELWQILVRENVFTVIKLVNQA